MRFWKFIHCSVPLERLMRQNAETEIRKGELPASFCRASAAHRSRARDQMSFVETEARQAT